MKHKIIKRKNRSRKYIRIIQMVYNNQIEMFRIMNGRTIETIKDMKNEEIHFIANMMGKTIQSLNELKFWLDELEPHIDFKINDKDFEYHIGKVLNDYEKLERGRRIKEGLRLSKLKKEKV